MGAQAHAEWLLDRKTYRPLVIEMDALGTHFIDALFGDHVRFHEGQVWSETLPIDIADLEMPDMGRSRVYEASLRLARLAVEAAQGRLFIATPVLSCPINIGINLFGDRLLTALMERPDTARRALRIITEVIAETICTFAAIIPPEQRLNSVGNERYAPPGFGFIDNCATQLISARHYREFFAPLDAELLGLYPRGGQIHLCGGHRQHIRAWSEMPQVRSVQLNDRAADDFARAGPRGRRP